MTNDQTPIAQDSSAPLASLQAPSDRENNSRSKASHKGAGTRSHSPRTMAGRKGNSTRSIPPSLCVEMNHGGSFRRKEAEDEAGDVDSLLKPSAIDFLGIGSQFGDHLG